MTWLLVFVLLHADGTITDAPKVPFETAAKCWGYGHAWAAQAVRREETVTVYIDCKPARPEEIEPALPAWKAGALPFGH